LNNHLKILKQYWGHNEFRPLQQSIIEAVIENKDVLALLPTGGGKSICFQVPALMKDGICIVVSPLIALIKDQVHNLSKKGIPALAIYSGMSFIEIKNTLQNAAYGNYKFLYLSPERLQTKLFQEYLPALNPNLIAIDEAHCISQWGYDFRPSYLSISALREQMHDVPIIALTASATLEVQNDICEKLLFSNNSERFQQSFDRPNLSYSVFEPVSKQVKLLEILKNVKGSSIVYCKSRKQTQQVSDFLKQHNINSDYYHAGMSNVERTKKQEDWVDDKINTIVCTNAFGMGIDKPNVRVVVHLNIPESLENYYQEAGRAGRDGKQSYAVLLYDKKEINDLLEINKLRFPAPSVLKKMYFDLMNFLQVPAGFGEGQSYSFDFPTFIDAFKWNSIQSNYSIQALAQEGLIYLSESTLKPSQIVFTCTKEELDDFEKREPNLSPITKGLLRSYEGIFDYSSAIYETQLAKFISTPIESVRAGLAILHQHNIVQYTLQSDKPQITLLRDRMYQDGFLINHKNIDKRKAKHKERIDAMINYTSNKSSCRSIMIGNYFNDKSIKKCNVCDNCFDSKKEQLNNKIFQIISSKITDELKLHPIVFSDIENHFKEYQKDNVKEVVRFLQAEKIVIIDSKGFLKLA
jgi:ATP-dependent DNA helicase RecQ